MVISVLKIAVRIHVIALLFLLVLVCWRLTTMYIPLGVRLRNSIDYCLYCCVEKLRVREGTEAVMNQAFTLVEGHVQQHP